MASLINVIIPAFNAEAYIRRCLDSVLSQTYQDFFVYVVDDGSKDQTLSIINEYSTISNKIVCISKDNGGLSSARNAGLLKIDYNIDSYVLFIDVDDYVENDYFQRMVDVIEKENVDIVCSSFKGFDDYGLVHVTTNNDLGDKKYNNIEALEALFKGEIFSQAQTKLFKSSVWRNILFDESLKFMEDQAIMFKLFYSVDYVYYYNYPGYCYYYSNNSLIRSRFDNEKVIYALRAYFEAVKFKYDSLYSDKILKQAEDCFSSAYLMLYPRFIRRKCDPLLLKELNFYKNYVKRNRLIKKASFVRESDKKKRCMYLISPILYTLFYRSYCNMKRKR